MASPVPFLNEKPQTGVVTEHRQTPEEDPGLMSAATELMRAISKNDAKGVASAMKNFFYMLDAMPHEEGSHEGEEG